jgi:glycosyltransferase involved in cell wall biosynthesis
MKILVIGGLDISLLNFRGALLQAMRNSGHDVSAAAPSGTSNVPEKLSAMGVHFVPVPLARTGLNPWADALSLLRLKSLIRRKQPDLVLSYTIKPVIYGSLAASWAGVPRIYALITGLGAAFCTGGLKGRFLRFIAVKMYRLSLARCTKVLVQNKEIAELFIREGIVVADKVIIVPGSGVDIAHFSSSPLPDSPLVFLLLARMLRDKGVEEFVAAARLVKKEIPQARFLLVGDIDPNPAAISAKQLDQWNQEGVVEYRPAIADVRPLLCACSVYVLPSYHEGLPRSVLEAMSTGRPIITTDTIGCRETIFEAKPGEISGQGIKRGLNGFLVPVRRVEPLAAVMIQLARDRAMAVAMGRASRIIAEQYLNTQLVNQQMLKAMNLVLTPTNGSLPAPHL